MKTQLLQDFQESGSAPSTPAPQVPPMPPRRPAVWHGPGSRRAEPGAAVQKADPGTMQRAPETSARGKGVAIEALADRLAQARARVPPSTPSPIDEATLPGVEVRPRPVPPQPAPAPDHVSPPHADSGTIPRPVQPDIEAEWLAARLREKAVARETPAWSSMWKRRLVTWSIACGLLAGLAAGGLWVYEDNRVEDALVVVANTSPAGQAPPAAAFVAATPKPLTPEPVKPVPEEPAAPVSEDKAPVAEPVDVTPPRRVARDKTAATRRATAKARRATAGEPSPRQRREETLMQCRAHGYDARQCIERACAMTRYGLVCKG